MRYLQGDYWLGLMVPGIFSIPEVPDTHRTGLIRRKEFEPAFWPWAMGSPSGMEILLRDIVHMNSGTEEVGPCCERSPPFCTELGRPVPT